MRRGPGLIGNLPELVTIKLKSAMGNLKCLEEFR